MVFLTFLTVCVSTPTLLIITLISLTGLGIRWYYHCKTFLFNLPFLHSTSCIAHVIDIPFYTLKQAFTSFKAANKKYSAFIINIVTPFRSFL